MVKKYDDGITYTIYLSRSVLEKAKFKCARLGLKFSSTLNELLEKWTESEEVEFEHKYEDLKRQLEVLTRKTMNLTKMLKNMRVYDEMLETAAGFGLNLKTCENLKGVLPMLAEVYGSDNDRLQLFISLLEATKKRMEVAKQLDAIRKRKYLSDEGVGDAETRPAAHTLPGAESVPEMWEPRTEENPRPEVSS